MTLEELRAEIDAADEQLLALFLRRMALSEKIAQVKAEKGLPIESSAREEQILHWAESNSGSLAPYSRELFQCLFSLSKRRQRELLQD